MKKNINLIGIDDINKEKKVINQYVLKLKKEDKC